MIKDKEYYIENAINTMNGWVYKDLEAFESGEGICYIGEADLIDLRYGYATLEQVAETRQTILKKCSEYEHPGMTLEAFAREVFELADWTCIYTILDQSEEWDWEE